MNCRNECTTILFSFSRLMYENPPAEVIYYHSSLKFLKQLNYTEDGKGVSEKQEAVMLADGQSNGLMGKLNE